MDPFTAALIGQGGNALINFFRGRGRDDDNREHETDLQNRRFDHELDLSQANNDQYNWMYGSEIAGEGQEAGGQHPGFDLDQYREDVYGADEDDENDPYSWLNSGRY